MASSARKRATRTALYSSKGLVSSRLRQRKHALVRRFGIPKDTLGGSLSQVERRCGKPTCHCADGGGHPMWTLTYSVNGRRHVEFIPASLLSEVQRLATEGREYREAVAEVATINAQLVSLWRLEERERSKKGRASGPLPTTLKR